MTQAKGKSQRGVDAATLSSDQLDKEGGEEASPRYTMDTRAKTGVTSKPTNR